MPSPMNDIEYDEFWAGIKARLDTATPTRPPAASMREILGGPGRVYVLGVDGVPDMPQNRAWARLIIVPTLTLWPQTEVAYETSNLAFLVRAEANNYTAEGFRPERKLTLAQSEAYQLLDAWLPTGYTRILFALPLRRTTAPPPVPMLDAPRGLLVTSSQYRADVAGRAAA